MLPLRDPCSPDGDFERVAQRLSIYRDRNLKRRIFMSLAIGLLMILTGLAIMAFGLFMFYPWLPLLYALIGFDVGILLGRTFTGDVGTTAIILGIAGAFILGAASYVLEPYRRVLLGVSGGILFGLSVAAAFGIDGWFGGFFGRVLALVCGAVGGLRVPRFFDMFFIGASAVGGAAMVMTGANHILPGVGFLTLLPAPCCRHWSR
jgi:hypothetical protein